jgi:hypothetical protein
VWETVPLPEGSQRATVLALAREAGFGTPRLRVWRTGNQVANAAIAAADYFRERNFPGTASTRKSGPEE